MLLKGGDKGKVISDRNSSVLSRLTLDNRHRPLGGERVASVASRVRGSAETIIVKNYAGHHTSPVISDFQFLISTFGFFVQ